MFVAPTFSPAKPAMRSKRVLRVTRMRTVPRSLSRSRNVRAAPFLDTTVPSNSRSAADPAVGAAPAGTLDAATAVTATSAVVRMNLRLMT